MKHSLKITITLLGMFFIAQLIGIYVAHAYIPDTYTIINQTTGEQTNVSVYNIPYGMNPPSGVTPAGAATSIITALMIAVVLMLLLMKLKAETFLRLWFFVVVTLGVALALNAFVMDIPYAPLIAIAVALPLTILKVFKRNLIVHNITEVLVYPGIASVFIPLLSVWSVVVLLLIISVYDIYAVWHAGFMQKMAKYQIEKVRIFSGFFIPYISPKDKLIMEKNKKLKKPKKVKAHVAILGGGDVVFPIILAGVVLKALGVWPAIIIAIGATIALGGLFYASEKGKFYPAMPFITAGCLIALAVAYLVA